MEDVANFFTFTFNVDPALNSGYNVAFKQGDETWWWYLNDATSDGPAAGPTPDFTNAKFKSLHVWNKQLLPNV